MKIRNHKYLDKEIEVLKFIIKRLLLPMPFPEETPYRVYYSVDIIYICDMAVTYCGINKLQYKDMKIFPNLRRFIIEEGKKLNKKYKWGESWDIGNIKGIKEAIDEFKCSLITGSGGPVKCSTYRDILEINRINDQIIDTINTYKANGLKKLLDELIEYRKGAKK